MGKQSFTPGPWQYAAKLTASENHRGFFIRASNGHGMWVLAEVQPGDEDGILGEENARLITAAPKLYEALQFARKYIAMRTDRGDQFPSQLTSAIEAALANASA